MGLILLYVMNLFFYTAWYRLGMLRDDTSATGFLVIVLQIKYLLIPKHLNKGGNKEATLSKH